MADKQVIIAEMEAFDITLLDFAKELGTFKSGMRARSDEVSSIIETMGRSWKRNGYETFKKNMASKLSDIESSLESCDELQINLEQASNELNMLLTTLKES